MLHKFLKVSNKKIYIETDVYYSRNFLSRAMLRMLPLNLYTPFYFYFPRAKQAVCKCRWGVWFFSGNIVTEIFLLYLSEFCDRNLLETLV